MYFVPFLELPYIGTSPFYTPCFGSNPYIQNMIYQPPHLTQPRFEMFQQPSKFSQNSWVNKGIDFQNICKNSTKLESSDQIQYKKHFNFEEINKIKGEEMSSLLSERSSSDKLGDKKKRIRKTHRKYNQNAERNVLTNIGNQLITFLGNRKRSQKAYLRINSKASNQEISQFYEFIHKLRRRKRIPIYINQKKLLELWYPEGQMVSHPKNYKMLRQMSLIFLQEVLPLFLINSSRIKKETKILHIAAARKMLHLLRYHQEHE